MIKLSNSAAQTILPGQAVTFDKKTLHTGRGECFNPQLPTSAKLCFEGVYEIHFNGNITANAAATPIQLSLAIGGSPLVDTKMSVTPAAAGTLVNVSASTILKNCCCDLSRISVINSGTNPLVLAPDSNFYIVRKS